MSNRHFQSFLDWMHAEAGKISAAHTAHRESRKDEIWRDKMLKEINRGRDDTADHDRMYERETGEDYER